MNQLGGGECSKIACNPANVDQRLVPWGGVAVSTAADFTIGATSGLAFCFLPLPTHTYLPVHVSVIILRYTTQVRSTNEPFDDLIRLMDTSSSHQIVATFGLARV